MLGSRAVSFFEAIEKHPRNIYLDPPKDFCLVLCNIKPMPKSLLDLPGAPGSSTRSAGEPHRQVLRALLCKPVPPFAKAFAKAVTRGG